MIETYILHDSSDLLLGEAGDALFFCQENCRGIEPMNSAVKGKEMGNAGRIAAEEDRVAGTRPRAYLEWRSPAAW